MIARNVFCVEFSFKEFVSLIIILVITKHPAAEHQNRFKETTSYTSNSPTRHHHTPRLCARAQGTADKEDEYGRLHYKMAGRKYRRLVRRRVEKQYWSKYTHWLSTIDRSVD